MAKHQPTLEEQLLNNAVDTIVKNVKDYDPVVLLHLMAEIAAGRDDLGLGMYRILTDQFPPERLRVMGVQPGKGHGMAGTSDDLMNYLTLPQMHRVQLRGIQQLQEKLMPGGFLMITKEVSHSDATRMLSQCNNMLDKALRLTKAVKATAEVNRLKEAIADGLQQLADRCSSKEAEISFNVFKEGMRASLASSKGALDSILDEAERMGG